MSLLGEPNITVVKGRARFPLVLENCHSPICKKTTHHKSKRLEIFEVSSLVSPSRIGQFDIAGSERAGQQLGAAFSRRGASGTFFCRDDL